MKIIRFLPAIFAMGIAFSANARPARPIPYEFRQPDGSTVMLRNVGDEFCHYTVEVATGMPVIKQGDSFYYASIDNSGNVAASMDLAGSAVTKDRLLSAGRIIESIMQEQVAETSVMATGSRATASPTYGLGESINGVKKNFVREGDVPCLVILVQFSDKKFTYDQATIEKWFNSETTDTYWPSGSVRSYFIEQSRGKFRPQFDVYGTYTAGRLSQYTNNAAQLVVTALNSLKSQIDLSKYDVNGDGAVDNVCMIYAGSGGHITSGTIYPANATVNSTINGYTINRVAYVNELDNGDLQGIGTFCHEFGHVLGLGDHYTTGGNYPSSTTDYWTPTYWDVMDLGCDLNYGATPPNMNAYELHALGWAEPYELNKAETVYLASQDAAGNSAMIRNADNPDEVVYLEYRDQNGWDYFHCGSGLLIWHVNYDQSVWNSNAVNNTKTNPRVKLICADGSNGNATYVNNSSANYYNTILYRTDTYLAGDPFPGTTNKTSFTTTSSPAFLKNNGTAFTLADNSTYPDITDIRKIQLNGENYMAFSVAGAPDTDRTRTIVGRDGALSSISDITDDSAGLSICSDGLSINVGNAVGRVDIFDVSGRCVISGNADAAGNFSAVVAMPGAYIIRCGRDVAKVMLR